MEKSVSSFLVVIDINLKRLLLKINLENFQLFHESNVKLVKYGSELST